MVRIVQRTVIMADVDTAILTADPEYTTTLAARLNAAMARSPEARAAYARTYGAAWAPLGCGRAIDDGASTSARTVR